MKKTLAAVAIAAATTISMNAFAASADVTTTLSAVVETGLTVNNIPTSIDFGTNSPATFASGTGVASTASNVQIYTNANDGVRVSVTSSNVANTGSTTGSTPDGQAVMLLSGGSNDTQTDMIPVKMVCTPCNLNANATTADAIQFSPAGNATTGASTGNSTYETVVSDTGGTRVVTLTDGGADAQYTTAAACGVDGAAGTAGNCTFTAGPTTGYEAADGSYSGSFVQTYSDITT